MKIIIQDNRIAAVATDEYVSTGMEQAVIDAPAMFDIDRISQYSYLDGELIDVPMEGHTDPVPLS